MATTTTDQTPTPGTSLVLLSARSLADVLEQERIDLETRLGTWNRPESVIAAEAAHGAQLLAHAEAVAGRNSGVVRPKRPIGTWKMPYGASGSYASAPARGTAVVGTGVPSGPDKG